MDFEQKKVLSKSLEAEIIGASALMEAEELLDSEGPAFFRGFIEGYKHCMKLAEEFDAISKEEKLS